MDFPHLKYYKDTNINTSPAFHMTSYFNSPSANVNSFGMLECHPIPPFQTRPGSGNRWRCSINVLIGPLVLCAAFLQNRIAHVVFGLPTAGRWAVSIFLILFGVRQTATFVCVDSDLLRQSSTAAKDKLWRPFCVNCHRRGFVLKPFYFCTWEVGGAVSVHGHVF